MSVHVASLVWRLDLPANQKLVAVKLADYANDDGGDIFPGVERLAEECGMSERSIQRYLREFVDSGLLVIVAHAQGGRGRSTEYAYDLERVTELCRPLKVKRVTATTQRVTTETKRVTATTLKGDRACHPNSQEPSKEPSGTINRREFEEFYDAYPRKKKPGDAEKAYRAARKKASHDEIMFGLSRFKSTLAGKDLQFVPYPASWLRADAWLDEPDPPTAHQHQRSALMDEILRRANEPAH